MPSVVLTLVGSLMNRRLIDELQLVVAPIVLGSGKALFKDVERRHALKLLAAKTPLSSGAVRLTYRTDQRRDPLPRLRSGFGPRLEH